MNNWPSRRSDQFDRLSAYGVHYRHGKPFWGPGHRLWLRSTSLLVVLSTSPGDLYWL